MGTSTIDGTIEEATLKRSRGGISVFDSIRFQLDDGSSRTIKKAVVKQEVADALQPGARGRFYQFTTFDLKSIYGARLGDGRVVRGFPGNNRKLFLILGLVNLAWLILRVFTDGKVPFLAVGLIILCSFGFVLMGKGQREVEALFDADEGAAAASRATPATTA